MIRLKASSGKCLISPVLRSRLAVLAALPVPAQLTRMRSWPMAARALAKAASTSSSEVTLHLAEDAADVLGHGLALGLVHVEDGDLDAVGGQGADGGFAEAGGAAGDHRGDGGVELHGGFLFPEMGSSPRGLDRGARPRKCHAASIADQTAPAGCDQTSRSSSSAHVGEARGDRDQLRSAFQLGRSEPAARTGDAPPGRTTSRRSGTRGRCCAGARFAARAPRRRRRSMAASSGAIQPSNSGPRHIALRGDRAGLELEQRRLGDRQGLLQTRDRLVELVAVVVVEDLHQARDLLRLQGLAAQGADLAHVARRAAGPAGPSGRRRR